MNRTYNRAVKFIGVVLTTLCPGWQGEGASGAVNRTYNLAADLMETSFAAVQAVAAGEILYEKCFNSKLFGDEVYCTNAPL